MGRAGVRTGSRLHDAPSADKSKKADVVREACEKDLKYFYLNVFDQEKQGLGRVHDFLIDFMRLDELSTIDIHHSPLNEYLEKPSEEGDYNEVWLHWGTLDSLPRVQRGPEGDISQLFHTGSWRGLIIRIAGDGKNKCVLMPRGHLKSTLCTQCHTLWEMIRDPSLRSLVRCGSQSLSKEFVGAIKYHFEGNDLFRSLYGDLGPHETIWRADEIQLNAKTRRGKESSLSALGMNSEVTGKHYDRIKLDDPVVEKNSRTPELREQIKSRIKRLEFVRDPGSYITDIGTIWAADDAHSIYTDKDSDAYPYSSFIVATVTDEDGNSIWPEVFTERELKRKRAVCDSDYDWFCQYYNQPRLGSVATFNEDWIVNESYIPERLAVEKKLNIYISVDPASTTNKQSDYSVCLVQGQSENGRYRYILDGFRERLSPETLPQRLVEIGLKWMDIASMYKGYYQFGIESDAFQLYVKFAMDTLMREQGKRFAITELSHARRNKTDRIKRLNRVYSTGSVIWPFTMARRTEEGRDYDLFQEFLKEFRKFPDAGVHDDILDCEAYGEEMMSPVDELVEPMERDLPTWHDASQYSREDALEEMRLADGRPGGRGRFFQEEQRNLRRPAQDSSGDMPYAYRGRRMRQRSYGSIRSRGR